VPQGRVLDTEVGLDGPEDFGRKGHKCPGELTALKGARLVRGRAVGCACNLLWSCSREQHLESGARGKRHASGNGISRGVKPADNVRPTQSEGKEGLPLWPMLTKETFV